VTTRLLRWPLSPPLFSLQSGQCARRHISLPRRPGTHTAQCGSGPGRHHYIAVPVQRGCPVSVGGRHRADPGRSRRRRSSVSSVVPRSPGIDLVDVVTKLAHKVSPEELLAGRVRGDYQGFCGERFRAASMVDPGRGQCQPCQRRVRS
jgi:hypothetical protein